MHARNTCRRRVLQPSQPHSPCRTAACAAIARAITTTYCMCVCVFVCGTLACALLCARVGYGRTHCGCGGLRWVCGMARTMPVGGDARRSARHTIRQREVCAAALPLTSRLGARRGRTRRHQPRGGKDGAPRQDERPHTTSCPRTLRSADTLAPVCARAPWRGRAPAWRRRRALAECRGRPTTPINLL